MADEPDVCFIKMSSNDVIHAGSSLNDDVDEERMQIRQDLASMSFEELIMLKAKLGTKIVNSALFGSKQPQNKEGVTRFTRENKNRPRELPSKKPVSSLKTVVDIKKPVTRDPRFDDLSGDYNEKAFRHHYSFLDDLRAKEKQELQKQLNEDQDATQKQKIKSLLQGMNEKEKNEQKKLRDEQRRREWRKQQLENVKAGKKPYFLKKSDEKIMALAEKYESLKKSGKLENYLKRKRTKNASKAKSKLPTSH